MAESKKSKRTQSESERRKSDLSAELARARSGMSLHAEQVKYQADINRRVKSSFREHVGYWLTGAVLTGGLIAMLPARQKKVYINPLAKNAKGKVESNTKPPQNAFVSVIKALMPIMKPALTAFVTKQLAGAVGGAKEAQKSAERTTDATQNTADSVQQTAGAAAN